MAEKLSIYAQGVDHLAIAVYDLEAAISWYTEVLGFALKERRETQGASSGMISAVIQAGPVSVVLLQGTSPQSQISMFIQKYGPGVQHIAIKVSDLKAAFANLIEAGVVFDTSIIGGAGLRQAFTRRDPGSGLMLELVERNSEGFAENNVSELFLQLENKGTF